MKVAGVVLVAGLMLAGVCAAQEAGMRVPSVEMAPVGKVQIRPGGTASVQLDFRVGSEFHINSNKPHSELLIPTALRLAGEGPLSVASVKYPVGQDVAFPFAPGEKLSVYSGDFSITTVVKAASNTATGEYSVSGQLRFQACDKSACYPPKSIPVKFKVTVAGK